MAADDGISSGHESPAPELRAITDEYVSRKRPLSKASHLLRTSHVSRAEKWGEASPTSRLESWRSRRLLRFGREGAGLHPPRKSPSCRMRTAIGPSRFDWSPALNLTTERATDAPTTPSATDLPLLDHERLDCYRVALDFAAMVPTLTHATRASLRDQLERAAASICLNIAEGSGRSTRRDRLHFFSIAQGSAMECAAAIDLLRVRGHVTFADATRTKHKATRIIQMLVGLRKA